MAFDVSGFSTAQKSPRAGTCATPILNVAGLWDPFLALVLRSHQYIHTLDGAAVTFLCLQPSCGGKVPYWLTVATQFQQVPIFDKKKKKKRKKTLKCLLIFIGCHSFADHLVCPQQVTGPSNYLHVVVHYPSAVYLRSISYDLLSWIFFFFLFVKFALRVRCHIKSTLFSHGVLYNRCGWGLWLGY